LEYLSIRLTEDQLLIRLIYTQSSIKWVLGALSLGLKRPGREIDRSPPSSAEVKEGVELSFHSSSTPSRRGAQFKKKAQGQLLPLPAQTLTL
jgi:hypothetical protein